MAEKKNQTSNESKSEVAIVAKLSIKAVGCDPKQVHNEEYTKKHGGKSPLTRMYGRATGLKYVDNKSTGTIDTKFTGTFEAVNLQNGNLFRSGVLYLPKGVSEMLESAVNSANKDDAAGSVDFAFEIRSVKASNPIGYSYEAVPLIKPAEADELEQLREKFLPTPSQQKALSA